jgi:hypothetical protein
MQLFLDDERSPSDVTWIPMTGEWTIVRSVEEFKAALSIPLPTKISFDHDLGPEPDNNGFKAAQALVDFCLDNNVALPEYQVHSKNPIGEANIHSLLTSFLKFQSTL